MSFRTAREVVDAYLARFIEVQSWCAGLSRRQENAEFNAAVAMVEKELRTRGLRFRAALETGEENALATYLQYDPETELREAAQELTEQQPRDPDALFEAVAEFYRSVSDALGEGARLVESTPAGKLFSELQHELQAAISSHAWKMRNET